MGPERHLRVGREFQKSTQVKAVDQALRVEAVVGDSTHTQRHGRCGKPGENIVYCDQPPEHALVAPHASSAFRENAGLM